MTRITVSMKTETFQEERSRRGHRCGRKRSKVMDEKLRKTDRRTETSVNANEEEDKG